MKNLIILSRFAGEAIPKWKTIRKTNKRKANKRLVGNIERGKKNSQLAEAWCNFAYGILFSANRESPGKKKDSKVIDPKEGQ